MIRCFYMDLRELKEQKKLEKLVERLPQVRREKYDRQKTESGKLQSLGAGILLMRGMECLGYETDLLTVTEGRYGKPEIPDINFSISHSGHFAVCGFSKHGIGVDIENKSRDYLKVAKRFFSEQEYQWVLGAASEDEGKNRFVRMWTLKESYLKYTGEGLRRPMIDFLVEPGVKGNGTDTLIYSGKTEPLPLFFYETWLEEYHISVCAEEQIRETQIEKVEIRDGSLK